uniref:SMC family ATPase n=1 Tax=Reinekea sp. TaxID=1970455 RepID=UPI002A83D531
MKPIHLSIQAFGPFAGTERIDFQALGVNPLFLINGPTGAGKSTVLDAICFALYGQTTGNEREAVFMRCDLSAPDLDTEVVFDFRLADQIYRIYRRPQQEVAKKVGVGTTLRPPSGSVYRIAAADFVAPFDESQASLLALKGIKEINEWVKTTTGLSAEQFRQVMVLPQGQFRKLLLADSDEREQIFSQLFQTQIFKQIEDRLRSESAQLRGARKSLRDHAEGLLASVHLSDGESLISQLAELEPRFLAEQAAAQQAEALEAAAVQAVAQAKSLTDKFAQFERLKLEQAGLVAQGPVMQQQAVRLQQGEAARAIAPYQQALVEQQGRLLQEQTEQQRLGIQIAQLSEDQTLAQSRFTAAAQDWQELDAHKAELAAWQAKQHGLQALTEQLAQLNRVQANTAQAAAQIAHITHRQRLLQEQRAHLHRLQQEQGSQLQQLPQLKVDLEQCKRQGVLKKQWHDLQTSLTVGQQQLTQDVQLLGQAEGEVEQAELLAKRTELAWHQGQATELARQLNDGEPCLVCGSVTHPNPAHLAAEATLTTKAELDRVRALASQGQQSVASLQVRVQQQSFQQTQQQQRADELWAEIGAQADQSLDGFRAQWQSLNQQIQLLLAVQQKQQTELTQIEAADSELLDLDNSLSQASLNRDQCVQAEADCRAAVQQLEQQIPEADREPGRVAQQLERLQQLIAEIDSRYLSSQQALNQVQQQLASQQSLLSDRLTRITALAADIEHRQLAWAQQLTQAGFASVALFQAALLEDGPLSALVAGLKVYHQRVAELTGRMAQSEAELAQHSWPDLPALAQALETAGAHKKLTRQRLSGTTTERESLLRVDTLLQKNQGELAQVEADYRIYGTLSDVASGQSGNRVSLQRFVLGVLLDDVLREASQRLQLMSKGRYILKRKLDR